MRIAVTGAGGRLGSALVAALMRERPLSRAVSVEGWSRPALDLDRPGTLSALVRARRPDLVIHAAAWTDVDGCARDPDAAMRRNGEATAALAEACREAGTDLLYVSTNEVFDGRRTDRRPYAEDDPVAPANAYGRSKLAGEEAVLAGVGLVDGARVPAGPAIGDGGTTSGTGEQGLAAASGRVAARGQAAAPGRVVVPGHPAAPGRAAERDEPRRWVVRTAWLYGPPGADFPARIISAAVRAAAEGTTLRLVADEIGSPTRAADLASGIVALVRARPESGVYHLVNAGRASRAEWAELVLREVGVRVRTERVPGATWQRASTPPAWGVLAIGRAAQLGIMLRGWRSALFDEMPRYRALAAEPQAAETQTAEAGAAEAGAAEVQTAEAQAASGPGKADDPTGAETR